MMQADEEFRSRLREDLGTRSQPPVGTLAADALSTGQRLRRRQRTLRTVGGAAAVAAVAVGSVALSGTFGADTGSSAVGPGGTTVVAPTTAKAPLGGGSPASSRPAPPPVSSTGTPVPAPARWVLPPATTVADPEWITPRAIVAEMQKILPQGTQSSDFSGDYAYGGGPRGEWAFTGSLTAATAKGPVKLQTTLHHFGGDLSTVGCHSNCTLFLLPGGGKVQMGHISEGDKGKFVWLFRPGGMSVQINVSDASKITDDELFALAANGDWGSLKLDKAFVEHAESTIKGDFGNLPSAG
ncbi:MAG: hypothetical protein HOV87_04245 [Catenulispora sp.]|nr:hypothetical protein [Catenulispora sp.]